MTALQWLGSDLRSLPDEMRRMNETVHRRDPALRLLNITIGRFTLAATGLMASIIPALCGLEFFLDPLREDAYGRPLSPQAIEYCYHMTKSFGTVAAIGVAASAALLAVPAAISIFKEWHKPSNGESTDLSPAS
jgi:hypothetical protein